MDIKKIKKHIKNKDYLFSEHADQERTKDNLTAEEIEQAVLSGKVIEERLDDPRGESRLVIGQSRNGKLIHIVIGLRLGKPVIVTNYLPSKEGWLHGKIRKRRTHE